MKGELCLQPGEKLAVDHVIHRALSKVQAGQSKKHQTEQIGRAG